MKKAKTTMSGEVMNKICNITERALICNGVNYVRNGSIFSVAPKDTKKLMNAQLLANVDLINRGVITSDMMLGDLDRLRHRT